ncbi:hypothetical protein ACXR2U_05750 [Jatrophihabitans sp. YIM 134969]
MTAPGPRDLADLTQVAGRAQPDWLVSLVQPQLSGGRLEAAQLETLGAGGEASTLRVSGLDQATFETLVADHGHRFTALHFWKCPRLADLSPLEDLPQLEYVAFFWNQRATRLWDFTRTPRLRGLSFEDFTRVRALDDLRAATTLQELVCGDVTDRTSVVETLDPLAGLTRLRRLEVRPRSVADGRIEPLGHLTELEVVDLPTNLFTRQQYAWLRARLPGAAAGSRVLHPLLELGRPLNGKDVLLIGRRQPFLNRATDAARIQKHVDRFEAEVAAFRADPSRLPD